MSFTSKISCCYIIRNKIIHSLWSFAISNRSFVSDCWNLSTWFISILIIMKLMWNFMNFIKFCFHRPWYCNLWYIFWLNIDNPDCFNFFYFVFFFFVAFFNKYKILSLDKLFRFFWINYALAFSMLTTTNHGILFSFCIKFCSKLFWYMGTGFQSFHLQWIDGPLGTLFALRTYSPGQPVTNNELPTRTLSHSNTTFITSLCLLNSTYNSNEN